MHSLHYVRVDAVWPSVIDDELATAMHAMETTVATTLGSTPGALAFARDMFLNVPLIADWQAIKRTCEHHVNENSRHANKKDVLFSWVNHFSR
jgi:hypothetical protein